MCISVLIVNGRGKYIVEEGAHVGSHCGWEYGLGLAHGNFSQVYIVLKEEQSMRVVKVTHSPQVQATAW